jgi:hypothetical protein
VPATAVVDEPEAPWLPWLRWLRYGLGAASDPRLRRLAAVFHALWLAALVLAFAAPAWAMLREARVFWQHARACIAYLGQMDYGESPLLAQAVQWLHGQQIYHDDSAPPFTVGNYTPVFTWVTAAVVALWTGVAMGAGRAVSAAASVGTAVAIAACTWEAAGLPLLWPRRGAAPAGVLRVPALPRLLVAAFAGGLYLSARYVWTWGVYGRVDSLALFFSMWGVWWVLHFALRPGPARLWVAALLFTCAVYTRQDVVEGAAASLLGLALHDWRRALRLLGWLMGFGLLAAAALMAISHGQFFVHVFLYNENRFFWATVRWAWLGWLQGNGGAVLLRLALAGAAVWLLTGGQAIPGLLLGLTVLTSLTVGKIGSSINYFLPLIAACCWCVGLLGLRAAGLCAAGWPPVKWVGLAVPALFAAWATGATPAWARPWAEAVPAYGHLLARAESRSQTLAHTLTTRGWGWTPTAQPGPEWRALIRRVAETPGPVVSEDMSFVVLAGKPLAFQPFELTQAAADGHWNADLFVSRLRQGYYPLVLLPVNVFDRRAGLDLSRWSRAMYDAVREAYVPAGRLAGQWLYVPAGSA